MNKRLSETLKLDHRSGLPIYLQIIEQIKQQLASEALKPGDQLPTVRALAEELRINFNTVARAYRMLDESGMISTQQGRGTYIMEKAPPEFAERLRHESLAALSGRFAREALRLGFSPGEIQAALQSQLEMQNNENNEGE
jgi:GntR family transcriptional regulator